MSVRLRCPGLSGLRHSAAAVAVAVLAWTAGCATGPRPAIEPAFAARAYTPIRIALLPPDIFMVVDQVGDNDPARSEALRQEVFKQVIPLATAAFRQRGYDLNLSTRWDGIVGQDGQLLVSQDELTVMANSILQFANGPAGGQQGPLTTPEIIAPDLAAKIGWATQSDALLYMNLKGVTTSNGKRSAQVIFAVVLVLLIVLTVLAESKGGGHRGGSPMPARGGGGGAVAGPVTRGAAPLGGRGPTPGMSAVSGARGPTPLGRGLRPGSGVGGGRGSGGRVYGGGPRVGVGVGVVIPLEGPGYTHEGQVAHDDDLFGDDQMYLSMTLVNASDGRVLWHLRDDLDLDAEDPRDLQELMNRVVNSIPMRGDLVDPNQGRAKP